jgi:hypothetical protein
VLLPLVLLPLVLLLHLLLVLLLHLLLRVVQHLRRWLLPEHHHNLFGIPV